jgi:hypothetical protein
LRRIREGVGGDTRIAAKRRKEHKKGRRREVEGDWGEGTDSQKITKVTKIKPGYLPRNYVLDADIVPGEAGSL